MKIKPLQYAQILIESTNANNIKEIAANFWHLLQKNKQYKDLPKILDLLQEEQAKKEGKILAKVYSERALTDGEIDEISAKLSLRAISLSREAEQSTKDRHSPIRNGKDSDVIIRNIIKPTAGGIVVEVEDKIIDLSTKSRVEKLKKKLLF